MKRFILKHIDNRKPQVKVFKSVVEKVEKITEVKETVVKEEKPKVEAPKAEEKKK